MTGQGSIATIATSTGTALVNESFSAYGNRRNTGTWSGAPSGSEATAINAVMRQGYTGQTALGISMGLNHMNGRIQDAITGRFLSPDPFVPDSGNTQSFNRYSYVNNNPLSFTDPPGFAECKKTRAKKTPGCTENKRSPVGQTTITGSNGGVLAIIVTGSTSSNGFRVIADYCG